MNKYLEMSFAYTKRHTIARVHVAPFMHRKEKKGVSLSDFVRP